jgi:hypothetical protein
VKSLFVSAGKAGWKERNVEDKACLFPVASRPYFNHFAVLFCKPMA